MSLILRFVCFAGIAFLAGAMAAEPVVGQKNKQFTQEALDVSAGTSVDFKNDDDVTHNIAVRDPNGANRPGIIQAPGTENRVAFTLPGDHDVRCLIHPKMKMKVRVN